jgi:DNA-binding MarR family transcriptional regulator
VSPQPEGQLSSEGALRAFYVVELLRSTGEREFPAQLMAIFLWIASHNGCRQYDLVDACSISIGAVSRNVTWLGPRHRLEHRSGLKLVRRERDPENYKAWRLFLTPKGLIFLKVLEQKALPDFKTALKEFQQHDEQSQNLG